MKQKIKWFIASLMVMVSLQVGAQPEGKFYLYSSYKAFLSRAANGDATIDNFGIPVEITKGSTEGSYSMRFLDNGLFLALSGTTVKSDQSSAAYVTIKAGDGGNYSVELKEGQFLGIEGNTNKLGVSDDPTSDSFNAGSINAALVSASFMQTPPAKWICVVQNRKEGHDWLHA